MALEISESIPEPSREIFRQLQNDLLTLHVQWKHFCQLYGEGSDRVHLLNNCAANFFGLLQWTMLSEILLGLSRLTDPPATGGQENLVLESLERTLFPECTELSDKLNTQRGRVCEACASFRARRNKLIAHKDQRLALAIDQEVLPGITRQMIEDALKEVREYLNMFQKNFTDSRTSYEHVVTMKDGNSLMHALRQADRYMDLVKAGTISPGDLCM